MTEKKNPDEAFVTSGTFVDDVKIHTNLRDLSIKETRAYLALIHDHHPDGHIKEVTIAQEKGDNVQVDYTISNKPMERIRRITGYLVGSIDRWNDAKRAEEHDRVKHSLSR